MGGLPSSRVVPSDVIAWHLMPLCTYEHPFGFDRICQKIPFERGKGGVHAPYAPSQNKAAKLGVVIFRAKSTPKCTVLVS